MSGTLTESWDVGSIPLLLPPLCLCRILVVRLAFWSVSIFDGIIAVEGSIRSLAFAVAVEPSGC